MSLALDQGDGLLKWNATPTFSSQWLSAQIGLPKLCYSYVELTEAGIKPETFQYKANTLPTELTGHNVKVYAEATSLIILIKKYICFYIYLGIKTRTPLLLKLYTNASTTQIESSLLWSLKYIAWNNSSDSFWAWSASYEENNYTYISYSYRSLSINSLSANDVYTRAGTVVTSDSCNSRNSEN